MGRITHVSHVPLGVAIKRADCLEPHSQDERKMKAGSAVSGYSVRDSRCMVFHSEEHRMMFLKASTLSGLLRLGVCILLLSTDATLETRQARKFCPTPSAGAQNGQRDHSESDGATASHNISSETESFNF